LKICVLNLLNNLPIQNQVKSIQTAQLSSDVYSTERLNQTGKNWMTKEGENGIDEDSLPVTDQ